MILSILWRHLPSHLRIMWSDRSYSGNTFDVHDFSCVLAKKTTFVGWRFRPPQHCIIKQCLQLFIWSSSKIVHLCLSANLVLFFVVISRVLVCFSIIDQKEARMSGELSLYINIKEPRWDQGTFMGRAKHFFMVTDPRNVLLSSETLEESRVIVENYRWGLKLRDGVGVDHVRETQMETIKYQSRQ